MAYQVFTSLVIIGGTAKIARGRLHVYGGQLACLQAQPGYVIWRTCTNIWAPLSLDRGEDDLV